MIETKTERGLSKPQSYEVFLGLISNIRDQWIPQDPKKLASVLQLANFVAPSLGFDKLIWISQEDNSPELTLKAYEVWAYLFAERKISTMKRGEEEGWGLSEGQRQQIGTRTKWIFTPDQQKELRIAGESASRACKYLSLKQVATAGVEAH